jgi:sarcosine oxidase, subunit gamma
VDERLPVWRQTGHFGAAGSGITFAEAAIAAAWNVQGNRARGIFAEEARRLLEVDLPAVPNAMAKTDALTALWLGPTSWLLVAGGASPLHDFVAKRDALNGTGGSLFDVGASRVAWTICGTHAATLLSKGSPLDFHPRAFRPGTCAQSLFGHVNALFVRNDDAFTVLVARSFARDVWHGLSESAAQYGYDVRPPVPYR